jgi:succinate dehydrogenase flavin-adding protein (antitoxin of CptAB toxin-antitoxin module)
MNEQQRIRQEKLRWRCRRALLELDIIFQRFWARAPELDEQDEANLEKLLAMEDHDLWYLVSGRTQVSEPPLRNMIERLSRA